MQVNPNRNVVDSQLVESKALFNKPSDVTPQDKVNLPKIILALQYFDGDYEEADALIRLIARMERTKRSDAIFLLSYRYDSKPPREETLGLLREKFATVLCQRGTRLGAGWPTGCNALWLDTMMHAADIGIERRATGVFCFESDVIPIARDWVTSVQKAWMDSSSRGKNVVGHLSPKTLMVPEHVNGNAIFNSQLMRMYPGLSVLPSNFAWDTYLAKDFKRYWEHSNFILNFYKSKDIKPSQILEWQQAGHALVHGIKDGSGRKHISNMM